MTTTDVSNIIQLNESFISNLAWLPSAWQPRKWHQNWSVHWSVEPVRFARVVIHAELNTHVVICIESSDGGSRGYFKRLEDRLGFGFLDNNTSPALYFRCGLCITALKTPAFVCDKLLKLACMFIDGLHYRSGLLTFKAQMQSSIEGSRIATWAHWMNSPPGPSMENVVVCFGFLPSASTLLTYRPRLWQGSVLVYSKSILWGCG